MSDDMRNSIRNSMNLKDTYELLEIWRINNRVVWSDITFEVIKEILQERTGEVPPQDEPIFEHAESGQDNDGFEDWEIRLLDDENQPELYDTLKVIEFIRNINKLIIAFPVVYILLAVLNFQPLRSYLEGVTISINAVKIALPSMYITVLSTLLQIGLTYLPLKALTHILRILMEMEFNSRKTN